MQHSTRQACFDQWMSEHKGLLYRVARAFAEEGDLDDLLQELMLAVWNAIPGFRGQAKPSTYLYRVTHNTALTWKRSNRQYRSLTDQMDPGLEGLLTAPATDPLASDQARLRRIYAALRRLPLTDRSLILLSLDGVSYREMADIQGLSESLVGVRLNRIKQRLAILLKEEVS